MASKLIIAGGSGSLGAHLITHLRADYSEIVVLSRGKSQAKQDHRIVHWDAEHIGEWTDELEGAEAIINLTGKSIQCRFTEENKRVLWDSRVNSTEVIGKAITASHTAPKVWINASGASIYPETIEVGNTEAVTNVGSSFLAQLSQAWEEAAAKYPCPNTRKVIARICPVMDAEDGFLAPLVRISKLGLGGRAGSGRQMVSWIHYKDLVRAFSTFLSTESMAGIYNLCAPDPKSNANLMRSIRKSLGVSIGLPAPSFAIKMTSYFIGVDSSLILDSSYVLPARLQAAGFRFEFENLEDALINLL